MKHVLLPPSVLGLWLLTIGASAAPRVAQADAENAGVTAGDSGWFEGEERDTTSAEAEQEAAVEKDTTAAAPEPQSKAQASAQTVIVVDRGTTDGPRRADRSARRHDGLYLRLSLGGGGMGMQTTRADGSPGLETGMGATSFDFMLGGTPTPGLTLGGGFMLDFGAAEVEGAEDAERRHRMGEAAALVMAGPFIDVFPNPRGGFHFGGMLGGAALAHSAGEDVEPSTYRGFGGSAWLGYQWWVARQWSLGAMLRGTSVRVRSADPLEAEEGRAGSFALLFTALYH